MSSTMSALLQTQRGFRWFASVPTEAAMEAALQAPAVRGSVDQVRLRTMCEASARAARKDSGADLPGLGASADVLLGRDLLAAIEAAGNYAPKGRVAPPASAVRSAQVTAVPSAANLDQTTAPPPAGPYVPPCRRPDAARAAPASAEVHHWLAALPPPRTPPNRSPPGFGYVSAQQRAQNLLGLYLPSPSRSPPGLSSQSSSPSSGRDRARPSALRPEAPSFQCSPQSTAPTSPEQLARPSVLRPEAPLFQRSAPVSGPTAEDHLTGLSAAQVVTCSCGGHRKDTAGPLQHGCAVSWVQAMHLCNDHHLLGTCARGAACKSHHVGGGLTQAEKSALLCVARWKPCRNGVHCRVVGCVYGHHCTYRRADGTCKHWGPKARGGHCVFTAAGHCDL